MPKTFVLIFATAIGGTAAWAQNPAESETTAPVTTEPETAAQPDKPFATLRFAFDSSRIDPADRTSLEAATAWLAEHPDHYLLVEGYTDPIGTYAYNAGLATRRGENVRTKLLAMGADPARLVVAVYGENRLVSSANAENRRVVVRATNESLDQIIARTFEQGMAVVWGYDPSPQVVAQRDLGSLRG